MHILSLLNYIISCVFFVCYFYQFCYIPIVWFFAKRFEKKTAARRGKIVFHDFAVLICARNEHTVIGDLVDSLRAQTYPQDKLKVFVMADNCTDDTAKIAREHGATVYERQNKELVGKGYALEELLSHVNEDFPDAFDGFFVFDADNILASNYIEKMNESVCDGNEVITSYRNSKNYGSGWIASGYALWFLRESRYLNNARRIINASSTVSGTGFYFSRAVMEKNGGWPFHLLTEDIEFSADQIVSGGKIAFCPDAVIYDEQPITFRQSWKQRKRWSRGYLQVLKKYGGRLIKGIFKGSFSCFDVTMNIAPAYILSTICPLYNIILCIYGLACGEDPRIALLSVGELALNTYFLAFGVGLIALITEWKRIVATTWQKIFSAFTFPLFMITFIPISISALFSKTKWVPIEHTMSVERLKKEGKEVNY